MSENKQQTLSTGYEYPGKRLILHLFTSDAGFAEKCAAEVLPSLELAIEELAKILKPTRALLEQPVHLFLIDAASSTDAGENNVLAAVPTTQDAAVYVLRQDTHNEQLLMTLTRTLVKRWFGEEALGLAFFLDGLAGVVAASSNLGPSLAEVHETIKSEIKARHVISIFASSSAVTGEEGGYTGAQNDIAASFVAYLLATYGQEALRQFFSSSNGTRQDQAALTVYHQALGQLEEAWLKYLRKPAERKSASLLFARQLFPFLKPYWGTTIKVLLYSLIGLAFNVIVPLSTRYLLDSVIPQKQISTLIIFSSFLLLYFILNSSIGVRRSQLTAVVVQHVITDMQQKSFQHLQRLSHRFYGEAKLGDLMARLSTDAQLVQQAFEQVMGNGLMMICGTITSLIVLFSLQPIIGLLVTIVIPLVMFCYNLLGKRFQQASADKQRLVGEAATLVQENLSSHAVVKAFGLETSMVGSYGARLLALLKASVRLEVIAAFFQNSLIFASLVEQLIVLGVGGYLVMQGQITLGTLMAAWSVMPALLAPVSMFGILVEMVQTASGSLERIVELQDEPVTIQDKAGALTLVPLNQEICLEHVQFAYESGRTIIDDLNVTIPAGLNIAIVGPSGSGKSSLISLLSRFWDPTAGQILFDGHDIQDVTLASLRDQIGLVFQDTFIFDTTVRENIAIGKSGATDKEIIAAAQGAKLDEYIAALPAGYNTMLGERGVRMSGGQRQRLAIARALLRNPRILILDEATSALDTQTEREILETLDELKRGRTTISITHRLTMAANADRILVLEGGKLVQQGTHGELLNQDGLYRRLYQEQLGNTHHSPEEHTTPVSAPIDGEQLRVLPLFQGVNAELLTQVAGQMVRRRYEPGEYILNQGEPGSAFYLIRFGQVEVLLNTQGKKRCINVLDEGAFFGEISLLAVEQCTASVRAVFPTECYVLTRAAFSRLLDQEQHLSTQIWNTLAQRRSELATIQAFLQQGETRTNLLTPPLQMA